MIAVLRLGQFVFLPKLCSDQLYRLRRGEEMREFRKVRIDLRWKGSTGGAMSIHDKTLQCSVYFRIDKDIPVIEEFPGDNLLPFQQDGAEFSKKEFQHKSWGR